MEKVDITIIGAGAVGLAAAYELSQYYKNIILLEKNESFGKETSSRNSEVIHAGIYYFKNSLKAKLCLEGKSLLYEFLNKHSIPFKKCGKYIIAVEKNEIKSLEALKEQAEKNNVCDLKFITRKKFQKSYPDVKSFQALFSPSTGIFNTQLDLQGMLKLGPNIHYIDKLEYEVEDNWQKN